MDYSDLDFVLDEDLTVDELLEAYENGTQTTPVHVGLTYTGSRRETTLEHFCAVTKNGPPDEQLCKGILMNYAGSFAKKGKPTIKRTVCGQEFVVPSQISSGALRIQLHRFRNLLGSVHDYGGMFMQDGKAFPIIIANELPDCYWFNKNGEREVLCLTDIRITPNGSAMNLFLPPDLSVSRLTRENNIFSTEGHSEEIIMDVFLVNENQLEMKPDILPSNSKKTQKAFQEILDEDHAYMVHVRYWRRKKIIDRKPKTLDKHLTVQDIAVAKGDWERIDKVTVENLDSKTPLALEYSDYLIESRSSMTTPRFDRPRAELKKMIKLVQGKRTYILPELFQYLIKYQWDFRNKGVAEQRKVDLELKSFGQMADKLDLKGIRQEINILRDGVDERRSQKMCLLVSRICKLVPKVKKAKVEIPQMNIERMDPIVEHIMLNCPKAAPRKFCKWCKEFVVHLGCAACVGLEEFSENHKRTALGINYIGKCLRCLGVYRGDGYIVNIEDYDRNVHRATISNSVLAL